MTAWISGAVLGLYYGVLFLLSAYGLHRLVLVLAYRRHQSRDPMRSPKPDQWPVVTVQLPMFNERYVAERLIAAVARLDYPADRLEIQVLDDSIDETRSLAAAAVYELQEGGLDIQFLHREERSGYKAGALESGLRVARGEFIAVFDADFVPPPDFLRQTVPWFADSEIGMVQARWGHLNREWSLLTRIQALMLDGHFVIEHTAREVSECFFNFNGTAGVWRRRTIEEAGGWQHDTVTEDLDLSYRAQLAGWRFRYLPEVVVPAELPAEIGAYKSQQHRWAKGSIQTARKLLPRILRSPLPLRVKLEALVHLTNNSAYLLMVLLSLAVYPAMWLRWDDPSAPLLWLDLAIFLTATGSVLWFYATSQRAVGRSVRPALLFALMGLGIGLAANNARAVVEGLRKNGGEFHRTPKFRLEGNAATWVGKEYLRRRDLAFWFEIALALYLAVCTGLAVRGAMWPCLPFLALFLLGHVHMVVLGSARCSASSDRVPTTETTLSEWS